RTARTGVEGPLIAVEPPGLGRDRQLHRPALPRPVAERGSPTGKPEVGRVVVARDEPRRALVPDSLLGDDLVEIGHLEHRTDGEFDLALERHRSTSDRRTARS